MYYSAGMMDLVLDAVEAVRYLSLHPRIDEKKIILLGHSEGAIILPLVCREVTKSRLEPVLGCIFYCGFGENIKDAMTMQKQTILNEVREASGLVGWIMRNRITKETMEKNYDNLLKKVYSDGEPDFVSMRCGLVKQPAKWFREHMEYDSHAALVEHISCHCLAVTGCKDVQVRNEFCTSKWAAKLVTKAASTEMHRPENLNHALRSLEGPSRMLNIKKDYTKMSKMPLDAELLSITDAWCDRVLF